MHIPYENPEHPEKYIILNHSPYYNPCGRFCRCKAKRTMHKKLCFRNMTVPHRMYDYGQVYICIKTGTSVWIQANCGQRYFTLKQFEKWFDEIIDYDIHTLEKAREKYNIT